MEAETWYFQEFRRRNVIVSFVVVKRLSHQQAPTQYLQLKLATAQYFVDRPTIIFSPHNDCSHAANTTQLKKKKKVMGHFVLH